MPEARKVSDCLHGKSGRTRPVQDPRLVRITELEGQLHKLREQLAYFKDQEEEEVRLQRQVAELKAQVAQLKAANGELYATLNRR